MEELFVLLVFLVVGLPVWAVLLALLIDQGSKFYHQCIVTRRPGYEPPPPEPFDPRPCFHDRISWDRSRQLWVCTDEPDCEYTAGSGEVPDNVPESPNYSPS